MDLPFGSVAPFEPDTGIANDSSITVFHPPQLSQRPDHLEDAPPQDWQTKFETLAMAYLRGTFRERKSILRSDGRSPYWGRCQQLKGGDPMSSEFTAFGNLVRIAGVAGATA